MDSIPAGYQLHINSWENDADAYNTEIISGLTQRDVEFLLFIVQGFKSRNDPKTPGIGNGFCDPDVLVLIIRNALSKFYVSGFGSQNISTDMRMLWNLENINEDELTEEEDIILKDAAYESICMLLGYPQESYYQEEPYFCRVFQSFKVYNFIMPVEDVSHQFK